MPGHNELMVFIIISPVSEGYVMVLLYPPYPKDMLWFYVEAARRPPPAMVLTR